MDGSENLTGATDNLTSSTMGSILVRNMKELENTANDSLPSSSSDANTAAAAVITQDDPISSTSEEVVAYKKVFDQQTDSSLDLQMDSETAQIAHQLDIANAKDGSQTKNFEDIASELENLLEESAGDYKSCSKIAKRTGSIDHRDINLDWDIDCEYSLTSKNNKILDNDLKSKQSVCDNESVVPSNNVNIETPSSSREIIDSSEKNIIVESISHNNIVEHVLTDNTITCDLTNNKKDTLKSESHSGVDNKKLADPIDIDCPKEVQSDESVEHKDMVVTTVHPESLSTSPNLEATEKSVIDECESKAVMEVAPNDEAVKNEDLEAPLVIQMKHGKDLDILSNKEDLDQINGAVESTHTSHSETKMIVPEKNSIVQESISVSCASFPSETKSLLLKIDEREDGNSSEVNESKQISIEYCSLNHTSQSASALECNKENAPNLDTASSMESANLECSNNKSSRSALEMIPTELLNSLKPIETVSCNADTITTSVIETTNLKVLENSISLQTSILENVREESSTSLRNSDEIANLSTNTISEMSTETSDNCPVLSSPLEMVPEKLVTYLEPIETDTSNLNTTASSTVEAANVDSTDTSSLPSSTLTNTHLCTEPYVSLEATTENISCDLEIENSKSLTIEQNLKPTCIELDSDNIETSVVENVFDVSITDNCDNYMASSASTMSADICLESDITEVTPSDEIKTTLTSTDTASDSSALIFTCINSQESNLPVEPVMEEYIEPSDQPSYGEEIYQSQELVQNEESYSQEQSFDSYEEQEEDTLESALIKAAVDAEHTRREITARKQKEREEEQAKLREQAELTRKKREKNRLEAEKTRKLLEEEEQRERDLLNRQIQEQQKLKEERKQIEEKAQEKEKITQEKILVDERKIIEENKLSEQLKVTENIEPEKAVIFGESFNKECRTINKDVFESEVDEKTVIINVTPETIILKPLNIEVEEQSRPPNIPRDLESTLKDGNNSEQPSESEEDNKPEYSSKMSQESLKMTITKNKTDELDTILKVYDPCEEDQTIRKLKIKPVVEENVKIIFKNLHEKIPHSPKRSLRNISPNRPQSPKITIKPIKQESPLKITIKSMGRKSDETEPTQQISPKITIKPIINNEEDCFLGGKLKNIQKEEEEERLHSPKVYKNDSERASSPKITIKPLVKPDISEVIPKLNIRLNKREQSPKHSSKNTKNRDEENIVEPLKLNIKQYTKDPSSISPKITFKPVVRPHEPIHESDDDHNMQERIVLKINKSNYQVDSQQMRKREAPEDIEKLAKIKLKVSKKPGHAHIVNEQMEALKRSLPEGIELVDIKKSKVNIPTHTQGGATITPIVMNEPTSQQEELSSDSVIFVSEGDSCASNRDELIVTPVKLSTSHVLTPVTTPPPKRRGRPRKVPLEPRDVPIEEPPMPTSSDNLLMITSNPHMSLLEGGHFLLSPTGSASGGLSPRSEMSEQMMSSGRPKRSCRGPSAHTQLGIKPRKPRGAGRARGGRGRGHRGGLRGGGVDKHGKFERIAEPKLKLLKESALSMKITDAFDRQDIAIRIVDSIQEQCGIPTSGRRRGGGSHNDNSDDDDDGGTIISGGGGGLEIIPRYGTMDEDEPMEMGTDPIKHGLPGKGRIGFLASGVIDITADDSLPPPEDEDDDDEMTGVEEVVSSSSPPLPCSLDRQLKIVIGRNDQIGHELIMTKDIVIYEEETRMSTDNGSRSGTPGKQVSPAVDPLAGIIDMAMPCEDTQSSMQSSGTTESAKVVGGADASTSKTSTRRTICRSDLSQDIDALIAITLPEQLAEYHWQGDGPFMLQEQIAEYLGVKSFKRKYPHINRRAVDMQERDYIRDNSLASEAMCNLGLTVLNSADVLDIMYSDFQVKYEEYCKHRRDKEAKEIMNRQRAINLAASQEKTKQDLVQTAISSAAQWNARLNRTRREQRPACMDLQTFTINYPKGSKKVIPRGHVGDYPLALVPGQYTDYYQTYTPNEISNLPFNTILHTPVSQARDGDDSGSESDSTGGSDSGTDSSSGSSGTSSSSSDDEDDNIAGKGQILPLHARSPIATPSGKRLVAVA